jgi:CheY-like chemotaxis protein
MRVKKINSKILLVDDEEACLISAKLMLEGAGYNVEVAHSGKEALDYLKLHYKEISLIFLDLMMPDINGIEFMKKISKLPDLLRIPIILQTGISENNVINQAIKMGALGCIRKPYNFETMHTQIEKILN